MSDYEVAHNSSILVVDDDELLCKLLYESLTSAQYSVYVLNNGEEIENFLAKNHVNLVILDVLLPGKSGLYWLEMFKQRHPRLPVLILSAQHRASDRITGLQLGAKDYLTKPFEITELLLRVQNLLENQKPGWGSSSNYFDPERAIFIKHGQPIKLTTTEVKLLKFLHLHANKVISRDEISEALRGNQHHPLDRSIDVHINRLRNKIEEQPSVPKLLNTVWGKGYMFVKPGKASHHSPE
ncbi:MAG: response regulator transcription factor [Thiolinea sp.]